MPASVSSALSPPLWAPVLPASLCRPRKIEVPGGAPRSCRPWPGPAPPPFNPKQNSTALAGLARQHYFEYASYVASKLSLDRSNLKLADTWQLVGLRNATAHMGRDLCIGNGGSASNFFCRPTSSWKAAAAAFHFFIRRGMVFIWKKLRHWWQLSCGHGSSRARRWRCGSSRARRWRRGAARLPSPTPPSPAVSLVQVIASHSGEAPPP